MQQSTGWAPPAVISEIPNHSAPSDRTHSNLKPFRRKVSDSCEQKHNRRNLGERSAIGEFSVGTKTSKKNRTLSPTSPSWVLPGRLSGIFSPTWTVVFVLPGRASGDVARLTWPSCRLRSNAHKLRFCDCLYFQLLCLSICTTCCCSSHMLHACVSDRRCCRAVREGLGFGFREVFEWPYTET